MIWAIDRGANCSKSCNAGLALSFPSHGRRDRIVSVHRLLLIRDLLPVGGALASELAEGRSVRIALRSVRG